MLGDAVDFAARVSPEVALMPAKIAMKARRLSMVVEVLFMAEIGFYPKLEFRFWGVHPISISEEQNV